MKNEIYILCNSPQCLNEISSVNYPNLHNKNIFTCNLAYSYFRTSDRHLNIFTDAPAINDFLTYCGLAQFALACGLVIALRCCYRLYLKVLSEGINN